MNEWIAQKSASTVLGLATGSLDRLEQCCGPWKQPARTKATEEESMIHWALAEAAIF